MEKDVLPTNASVDIVFDRKETDCSWDLKVTDKAGMMSSSRQRLALP